MSADLYPIQASPDVNDKECRLRELDMINHQVFGKELLSLCALGEVCLACSVVTVYTADSTTRGWSEVVFCCTIESCSTTQVE